MVSLARRRLGIVALLWGAYVQVALAQPSDVSYAPQVLQQCASEPDALRVLGAGWDEDLSAAGAVGDIVYLAERNWWRATKELLRLVREQSPQTDLEPARRFITSVRDDAASALMLLRVNTAEDTTLSPAFQWAQDMDNIYLNVKFSSRMDGPTTVRAAPAWHHARHASSCACARPSSTHAPTCPCSHSAATLPQPMRPLACARC